MSREELGNLHKHLPQTISLIIVKGCKTLIQEFSATPDMALINLSKKVESFNKHIRLIWLANKHVEERPICPDMSWEKQTGYCPKRTVFGGCATMAGWGKTQVDRDMTCRTDFSNLGPDKHALLGNWSFKRPWAWNWMLCQIKQLIRWET